MRFNLLALAMAGALCLAACETTGGYGYGAPRQTQLSQCMRNALIGAGVGAVAGAMIGSSQNRGENAALGAAAGGLGTYGVCRFLSAREQQRVENAYYQSLNTNSGVNDSWTSDQGQPRNLQVSAPQAASGYGGECKRVTASVSEGGQRQQLPPETFCRNASGQWVPA